MCFQKEAEEEEVTGMANKTFGERKREEAVELMGIDPGSAYSRVMDGIRAKAVEDFRKKQSERR